MKTGIEHKTANILGIAVSSFTMEDLLGIIDISIASRQHLLMGVVNAAKIVNARKDVDLMRSIKQADLVLADGTPIVWLSRLLGTPLPQRLAGIDIMYRMLERASEQRYRVYFLGAKTDVVQRVVAITATQYPNLIVAGYRDGYFSDGEDSAVAQEIKESRSDILLVAMPSPRKENFLAKWYGFMQVPACHGVGGSFDVMAGLTKRAPRWMQNCGLEWFYRLIQEPRRMWKRYLVTNTVFIGLGISEIIRVTLNRLRGISNVDTSCSVKTDDE
jgi:N-acetylglucosaminyldiphosphoundecaprenol N-acetyl-beta-D-mannosaminyltransferase